jgi:hypothetical protein
MPTPSDKPDIRFTFKSDLRDEYDSQYERFKAHVVYMVEPEPRPYNEHDAGVRNPSAWDRGPLAPLADLVVTAQRDKYSTGEDWYAWRLCYERPYQVELDDAERMVKFLRSATRKLAKLEERYGRPESLAAFCARVADVLGCKESRCWGINYYPEVRANGTHYHWTDADGLRDHLARKKQDA